MSTTEKDKTVEDLALEIKSEFRKSVDAVKEIAEKALTEAARGIDGTAEAKEKADEMLLKMNGLNAKLRELEQKSFRPRGEPERGKSLGEQFVSDDKVKQFLDQANPRGRIDLSTKATLTTLTTDVAGAVGDAIAPTRLSGILPLPRRRLVVRDLLSQGQMDGGVLEYVRETGFGNSAAPVAETVLKPESDIRLDLVSTAARVIAHWMKASRQALSDISQLRSIIDERLLYGLAYAEELQLLNGDNTGQNLHGIIPQATAYVAPFVPAMLTSIDTLRLSMLQAALAEYPATGYVMHPTDWATIELMKDTTGRYLIGNPQGSVAPTLWGLPVVATQAIPVDKFLTGAFQMGAQIFDRWQARVEVATENGTDFVQNLITVLAEERLALAVYRPQAFIYGDFGRIS